MRAKEKAKKVVYNVAACLNCDSHIANVMSSNSKASAVNEETEFSALFIMVYRVKWIFACRFICSIFFGESFTRLPFKYFEL